MPSFAELKAKAAGATSSGVEKFHSVKDRHTSVPMAKTNWDPYSGAPAPPPPPPRSLVNQSTKPKPLAPLPPPPSRTSSAALSASSSRNNSGSPAPSLPSRSNSGSSPPPPPPRGKSAVPPAPPRASPSPAYGKPPPGPLQPPGNGGPPPIVRSTRPDMQQRRVATVAPVDAGDKIDWVNLSPEDKEIFFSWLDEFFANFKPPTSINTGDQGSIEAHSLSHAPPPIRAVTKPTSWTRPQVGSSFVLSHPPMTTHGSAALDLAHYFSPTIPWTNAWYNASGVPSIPPPLVGNNHHTYTSAWKTRGSNKTTHIGVFFSDLSVFWGTVDFTTTAPEDQSQVQRSAAYLSPPKPLPRDALVHAHETYGDTIALYAESFLGSGQYCARGECWDLANESLKYFSDYDYIPKPIPSISRTHGHLIFEGKASNGGREQVGRWRGGDDRIRRGDIVEWRKVKIAMKAAPRGSFYTLGDPDHTAIIVSDCVPSTSPKDAASLCPSEVGVIAVIEQSQGQLPERREYDLSCLEEGEIWIYRPIGMKAYLGVSDITAVPPERCEGLQRL